MQNKSFSFEALVTHKTNYVYENNFVKDRQKKRRALH